MVSPICVIYIGRHQSWRCPLSPLLCVSTIDYGTWPRLFGGLAPAWRSSPCDTCHVAGDGPPGDVASDAARNRARRVVDTATALRAGRAA